MPDINCDAAGVNNINESDCDNSDSESNQAKENNTNEIEKEDLIALEENCKLRDLPYDTCLQNELPEEANQVSQLLQEKVTSQYHYLQTHYLKSWQTQTNFHMERVVRRYRERYKLTLRKYVNACLLDQDGRFAKDIEYIFAMQYAVEHKQVRDSISVALRQTRGRQQVGRNLDAGMLKNPQHLQNLFKKDRAYTFLKNIRGSPPYCKKCFTNY